MAWLVILALVIWAWRQEKRIEALSKQLAALEARIPAPAPEHAAEDVLILDTPLPEASNDESDASFEPEPEPTPQAEADILILTQPVLTQPAPPAREEELLLTDALPPLEPPTRAPRERKLEQWLAENGLAWMGGGAFALGGIMLVAIAAQQSWFTPLVRLYCALGLGAGLIGASEWVLRREGAHKLAAALLAGAGVAIFYAAAWAAHALYGYIGASGAALALGLSALLMLALSFRHGQPLGVLALLFALLAPALTSAPWASLALTLYLAAAAAAGFGVAALQRWAWVGATALLGLYLWFAVSIGADDISQALALALIAGIGGAALALRQPQADDAGETLPWARAQKLAPSAAICVSSIALIWTWLSAAQAMDGKVAGPALVGALLVALAAGAMRQRLAPALTASIAIGAFAFGFMAYLAARPYPLDPLLYGFILAGAGAVLVAAIWARPHRRDRTQIAFAGAVGAALLTALGAFSAPNWHGLAAWAPLLLGAAALFAAAHNQARLALKPSANMATDAWAAAGAALVLLGVESLFPADIRTAAHAGAALGFAAAFVRVGWRALSWGALAAATLALAHAFSGELTGAALSLATPLWRTLAVLAAATAFLFGAARICAKHANPSPTGEALSAAGAILTLLGVFLGLRWLAAGGAGAPLDSFTETALRVLALMAAGHIALPRAGQKVGRIGALRGHALMALGFVWLVLMQVLTLNPWWGATPAPTPGASLFNILALAFAAPSVFLLLAARRLYGRALVPARLYAGAGFAIALIWALLEVRRLFHGANMAGAHVGAVEGACYGLIFLLAAISIAWLAHVRNGQVGADLARVRTSAAWAGLFIGGWLLLAAQQVWWAGGAPGGAFPLLLTLLAATGLSLLLGRLLSHTLGPDVTRFAAAAAACVFALAAGHGALRWLADEGMLHALWPLALVLIGAELTARAPGRDTIRHYLCDLQAIWANAAWPAAAFAALGLWLLFNPWWGFAPSSAAALLAIALCALAAPMSLAARAIAHLRRPDWFDPAARVAAAAHLFVAATLLVRAAFHDWAINPGAAESAELWTYSAVWALFGAGALALGAVRNDSVLRWCGLAILFATAAKVFAFDTARLSGIIRVASLLGLAAVATLTALAMRRLRTRAP